MKCESLECKVSSTTVNTIIYGDVVKVNTIANQDVSVTIPISSLNMSKTISAVACAKNFPNNIKCAIDWTNANYLTITVYRDVSGEIDVNYMVIGYK